MALNLLLVSWYFPPSNTIAAVRIGKLAGHLIAQGHDVRVLTAALPPYPQTLPVEVDEARIERTPWKDINALPDRILDSLRPKKATAPPTSMVAADPVQTAPAAHESAPASGLRRFAKAVRSKLSVLYQLLLNFPDQRIGWTPSARRKGLEMIRDWRPDGIFASGPPFTTLLIGYLLSRATGVPLVVEFRDRWSEDPYYPPPWWRRQLNLWLERRIVNHAVGITTVSDPWAVRFRGRFDKPVSVIPNGFDAEDFKGEVGQGWRDPNVLRILYTGGIYPGYRDPTPLFAAIARSAELKQRIEVHFYGSDPQIISELARAHGVESSVKLHDRVTHAEALRQQLDSDVLLLMQWDDPREQGNVPGKFAEYLGARRPILVLGLDDGVPATFVRQRAAGAASTDPETLVRQLSSWLDQKRRNGRLAPLSNEAIAGFSRQEQAAKLAAFLEARLAPREVGLPRRENA